MRESSKGGPLPDDYQKIDPTTGQQKDYVVLSKEEREKGFVRPVRRSYKHLVCKSITTMGQSIAETYARNPNFYAATFCVFCKYHFPIKEFVWLDDETELGS